MVESLIAHIKCSRMSRKNIAHKSDIFHNYVETSVCFSCFAGNKNEFVPRICKQWSPPN